MHLVSYTRTGDPGPGGWSSPKFALSNAGTWGSRERRSLFLPGPSFASAVVSAFHPKRAEPRRWAWASAAETAGVATIAYPSTTTGGWADVG